ncbi:PRD domain-containing protein [Clostridium sp. BJN0001]|uniref:PRD domain-containing protein n=1 Tax=Clostridium sp. BJN0001 TaxID=2930219 RepID=UPI001FD170D9|nr:PRD domain-containing protein [Clostridium sp. BJN0001]
MSTTLQSDQIVSKVFNNNIILVNSEQNEKILFAKGIGFGKKSGTRIPKGTVIDKVFMISDKQNVSNLNDLIKKIDPEFIALCEESIYYISKELNTDLNEHIHIGLIDHLFIAIQRLKNNDNIENPFLLETKTLYPIEFELARYVAKKIGSFSNVEFPEDEIGFITLHIHSARNDGKISNTIKLTSLWKRILIFLEDELNIKIDPQSLDYTRFLTHIKFAIKRILNNHPEKNELTDVIKKKYRTSYEISQKIAIIIKDEFNIEVSDDEIAYLAIHVERFRIYNA